MHNYRRYRSLYGWKQSPILPPCPQLRARRLVGLVLWVSPLAGGSPTFRHYAALRAGPRTSSLPSSALSRPPSGRPLRVRLAVSNSALAPCVGSADKSQDQDRLRRAGSESTGGGAVFFRLVCGGVLPRGGCRRLGRSPRLAPEGDQEPAGGATGGNYRWCILRCAQPGYRPWWWVRV